MNSPELDACLERIAELLELARSIVTELESGETVETVDDAHACLVETRALALTLVEESRK